MRPLAGTRRRGATPEEDARLEKELLSDLKERAEHVMLVDLGRNEVGGVARPGTVNVDRLMEVERYSHVMHISSTVSGELKDGCTSIDALRAAFPAGTVSGAPKIRAMEIIADLEPDQRGVYAGSLGYVSFRRKLRIAITLRTILPARRGHPERADHGAFGKGRNPGCLPGPPVRGPGFCRSGRAQRAVAWKALLDPPRQLGRAGGRRRSVRSDQVSLFDRGTGITASRAGGDRMDNRWHGHGIAPYTTPDLWRPVPSRVGAHQGRQEDPGQLHQAGQAVIEVIAKLVKCESLSEAEAAAALETIMRGDATPVQIAGFMVAPLMRRASVEELTGFARTARALLTPTE